MLYPSDEDRIEKIASSLNIRVHKGWKNFSRNRKSGHALVLDIPNAEALQTLIEKLNPLNQSRSPSTKMTYRAAAGGEKVFAAKNYSESFSFSPCAEADIIIRLTGLDFEKISVDKDNQTATVGSGVQVGYLDKYLYDKHQLVLSTSSLFGYPTATGLAANAGHGTGLWEPGFAGLIQSITICRPDGKIVTLDTAHEDFHTIRAAHLGLFGIVINQTFKCLPASKLECIMDATTIDKLLPQIQSGLFHYSDYVSVMYVPTYRRPHHERTKKDNVLILKWNQVSLKSRDKNHCPDLEYLGQDLSIRLQEAFDIPDMLSGYPKLIPDYMRYLVSQVSVGKDRVVVGPWPDLMHYQVAFPWKIDDADYLFQMSADGHELKEAVNHVVDTLSQYAEKGLYPVTYAIYFRVFSGTNGGLSTSQHEEGKFVCGFDIVSDASVPGYAAFKKEMQDYFIQVLGAKPHWGKHVPTDVDYEAMYGDGWREFKQALGRWYQASGTSFAMSPLLTPYFAKILKVPEVMESLRSPSYGVQQRLFSGKTPEEVLGGLSMKIPDDGAYGSKLRQGFKLK